MTKRSGFTLVELVVVIVTVGMLAGLAVIGGARYQASIRDEQRSAQVSTISKALETYFSEKGRYPNCNNIAKFNTESITVRCNEKLAIMGDDFIEYQKSNNGSFTLHYKDEMNGTIKQVSGKQVALTTPTVPSVANAVAPSTQQTSDTTIPVLTLTQQSPSQVTVSWTASSEATSTYTVFRSTDQQFETDVHTNWGITDTSFVSDDLKVGKTYYFKVQAVSKSLTTDFSNVVSTRLN